VGKSEKGRVDKKWDIVKKESKILMQKIIANG